LLFSDLDLFLFARRLLRRMMARVVVTTEANLLRKIAVVLATQRFWAASV
jgi:hypothetical protein